MQAEEAARDAGIQRRLLHCLAAGQAPDGTEQEVNPDGWTCQATLYDCQKPSGGHVLVVFRDEHGVVKDTNGWTFDVWRDHVRNLSFEHHLAEHLVSERLAATRHRIWDGEATPLHPHHGKA